MAASTQDPTEIEKFSALAVQWWNPRGPFCALHRINPTRLQYIRDTASAHFGLSARPPLTGLSILDIGCGGGLVSAPLARMGATVRGIDASGEAIGAARVYAEQAGLGVAYEIAAVEDLTDRGVSFDLVTALEIVEHVADVGVFLAAASRLVRAGGLLVVSTINRTPKARALAIAGAERVLKWAPEGAHDYEKLVTPDEIRAGAPDLSWEAPVGIAYEPLGRGWTLSRDTDVNYMMTGRKPG